MPVNPNAREKRWLNIVAEYACIATGFYNTQLHHVKGRTAKHNKVAIGHIWILPLHFNLHDVSSNSKYNVTHYPKRFEEKYGTQKNLFFKLVSMIKDDMDNERIKKDYEALPTIEEIQAIKGYRR